MGRTLTGMPLRSPSQSRRVWFLFPPRTGLLNIAGPWEVLGHANDVLGRTAYQLELFGTGGPHNETGHGLVVSGVRPLPRGARLPDVVVVAGAPLASRPGEQEPLAAWLRRHHRHIPTIVSI